MHENVANGGGQGSRLESLDGVGLREQPDGVEGEDGDDVYEEPRFQVSRTNNLEIVHPLALQVVEEAHVKVEQHVEEKRQVHEAVEEEEHVKPGL